MSARRKVGEAIPISIAHARHRNLARVANEGARFRLVRRHLDTPPVAYGAAASPSERPRPRVRARGVRLRVSDVENVDWDPRVRARGDHLDVDALPELPRAVPLPPQMPVTLVGL